MDENGVFFITEVSEEVERTSEQPCRVYEDNNAASGSDLCATFIPLLDLILFFGNPGPNHGKSYIREPNGSSDVIFYVSVVRCVHTWQVIHSVEIEARHFL